MRKLAHLLSLAAALSLAQPMLAGEEAAVSEFGFIEMRPFGYLSEEGGAEGHLVDIANVVLAAMSQPVAYRHLPAPRLYQQLRTGETAFALGPRDLSFIRDHAFQSKEPLTVMKLSVYRRPGTAPIKKLEDFLDKHVVLLQGYSYGNLGPFFQDRSDNMELEYARTHLSGLKMIQYRRADYLVDYALPAQTVIANENLSGLVSDPLSAVGIHLFVSRKYPEAKAFIAAWDERFAQLRLSNKLPAEIDPRHIRND
jgi:polar amino acid transport system substrate-binding protein